VTLVRPPVTGGKIVRPIGLPLIRQEICPISGRGFAMDPKTLHG
jgi:hypothetical protein